MPLLFASSGSGIVSASDQIVSGIAQGSEVLRQTSLQVVNSLLPFCVNLRVIIGGFSVMFGRSSLAEELATITLRALLVSALVFSSLYSEIIGSAATKMASAGRQLSTQIMNAMGAPGSSAEPIDYWCDWINGKDKGGKPRFGYDYISTKIINAKSMVQEAQQALSRVGSS